MYVYFISDHILKCESTRDYPDNIFAHSYAAEALPCIKFWNILIHSNQHATQSIQFRNKIAAYLSVKSSFTSLLL